jgi:hypothetical protein
LQAKLGLLPISKDGESQCNVKLPDPQPLASMDQETVSR